MIANNYFLDDPDLQTFFNHLIDWDSIVQAVEGNDFADHRRFLETGNSRFEMAPASVEEAVGLYRSSLESLGEFCGKELSQVSQAMDRAALQFQNGRVVFPSETISVYEKFRETGLMPYSISRHAGGLGLPATVGAFIVMLLARADVSFCMTITLLNLAQIVARYGTEEQIEQFAAKAAAGETLFAMALTEPDYGSDLNSVRMTAIRSEDGSYRLNGTKRFISQGCGLGPYPCTLLTLARTGKAGGGARGLSVFLVKSEDVTIAGIESKMGIHASPTCEVVYEDAPGQILGEEGLGLTRYTAGMTNFMRLGSAAGGPGGGAGAYFECEKYASSRIQFGKPIAQIPAVAEMIQKIRREVNAMRLLAFETARIVDLFQHHQIRLEKEGVEDRDIRRDETIKTWSTLASILTPVAKYYCSEEGHRCGNLAVQIHGGAGYTEDYDVSRMFRDSRINTIYEGTSQIHVRIATGAISAGMGEGANFRKYLEDLYSQVRAPSTFLIEQFRLLQESVDCFRMIESEDSRERLAENLMIVAARFLCTVLYEKALGLLANHSDLERWRADCRSYGLESAAIASGCFYRLKNSEFAAV